MSDLEGVLLSDYLLLQCISKGGVADVYRAHQNVETVGSVGKTFEVAVKIFRPGYAQRESFRDYFMIEVEKIGQFNHPNILPFLAYGEGEDLLYLVMPFVTNGTLDDLLKRVGGRFSAIQALPIVQQLCSAVQYAHDHDVLHGNIKPSNVFVTSDGRILLSDFGIARGYDDSQQSLTRVGWGSAEYAAPEQSLGILRRASDIYSLGVLLFRILTGSTPFTGQTPVEVLLKHVRQQPPSARTFVANISDAIAAVLLKAMQKRSDDRFSSANDLLSAFTRAVMFAPVASPIALPLTTARLQPLQSSLLTNPLTPPPTFNTPSIENPQTPIPPYIALDESIPAASALPQEFSPTPLSSSLDGIALPPHSRHPSPSEPAVSEATGIRKKSFLEEDVEKDKNLLWSVNPAEWSPIAKEAPDENSSAVLLTTAAYLQSKPLILEAPASESTKEKSKEKKLFNVHLKKLLPLLVVILLLLGLLGALFSTFFYPGSRPEGNNGNIITKPIVTTLKSTRYVATIGAGIPSIWAEK